MKPLHWPLKGMLGAGRSPWGGEGTGVLQSESRTNLCTPALHLLQEECREATSSFYGVSLSASSWLGMYQIA